jgi:hypothetical protein
VVIVALNRITTPGDVPASAWLGCLGMPQAEQAKVSDPRRTSGIYIQARLEIEHTYIDDSYMALVVAKEAVGKLNVALHKTTPGPKGKLIVEEVRLA